MDTMTWKDFRTWFSHDGKIEMILLGFAVLFMVMICAWIYTGNMKTTETSKYAKNAQKRAEMIATIEQARLDEINFQKALFEANKIEIGMKDLNNAEAQVLAQVGAHDLSIDSVTRSDSNSRNSKDINFNLSMTGRWIDCLRYLIDIQRSQFFIKIDAAQVEPGQGTEAKMVMRYRLITTLE